MCVCLVIKKGEMKLGQRGKTGEAAGGGYVGRRDSLKGLVNY